MIIFIMLFSVWTNASFAQNTAPAKTITQSIRSIKIAELTDPEVKTFFISYHAQRTGLVPFTNEIIQSPYVKELSKEYLKN